MYLSDRPGMTVGDLKKEQFSNQERASLSLIFRGEKLANDKEKLVDLFRETEIGTKVTMHAVLPPMSVTDSPASSARSSFGSKSDYNQTDYSSTKINVNDSANSDSF